MALEFSDAERDRFRSHLQMAKGGCIRWTGSLASARPVFRYDNGKTRSVVAILHEDGTDRKVFRYHNLCGDFRCVRVQHQQIVYRKADPIEEPPVQSYTPPQRSESSLSTEVDAFAGALSPLLRGIPSKLWIELPVQRGRTRAIEEKLVVIVPGQIMGSTRNMLLVSLVGKGSVVVDATQPKKIANLVLAGFPAKSAGALMDAIHRLYQEK